MERSGVDKDSIKSTNSLDEDGQIVGKGQEEGPLVATWKEWKRETREEENQV